MQNWTIEDCLYHFERICSKTYPRHTKRATPVLSWIREKYKSRSETTAFEMALREAFSDTQHLFGDPRPSGKPGSHTKVAVTATSSAGRTVVLGNYNRYASKKRRYLIIGLPRSFHLCNFGEQFGIIFAVQKKSRRN